MVLRKNVYCQPQGQWAWQSLSNVSLLKRESFTVNDGCLRHVLSRLRSHRAQQQVSMPIESSTVLFENDGTIAYRFCCKLRKDCKEPTCVLAYSLDFRAAFHHTHLILLESNCARIRTTCKMVVLIGSISASSTRNQKSTAFSASSVCIYSGMGLSVDMRKRADRLEPYIPYHTW